MMIRRFAAAAAPLALAACMTVAPQERVVSLRPGTDPVACASNVLTARGYTAQSAPPGTRTLTVAKRFGLGNSLERIITVAAYSEGGAERIRASAQTFLMGSSGSRTMVDSSTAADDLGAVVSACGDPT